MVVLALVVVAAVAVLIMRLAWLQILQRDYYKAQAVENSTRVTFLRAPRGTIYDRHGNLLATNKQSISMIAIPIQIDHVQDLANRLSKVLDVPAPKVLALLLKAKASHSVLPVVIAHDLDMDTMGKFYDQQVFLPGIDILPDISRNYTQGELTAHVLGYCGEITQAQLEHRPDRRMGDVVGQDGVERLYDDQLRGVDGEQRVRVNALGQSLSKETAKPVVTKAVTAGQPVVLSLCSERRTALWETVPVP
jgi:penicillin-binding protein 2